MNHKMKDFEVDSVRCHEYEEYSPGYLCSVFTMSDKDGERRYFEVLNKPDLSGYDSIGVRIVRFWEYGSTTSTPIYSSFYYGINFSDNVGDTPKITPLSPQENSTLNAYSHASDNAFIGLTEKTKTHLPEQGSAKNHFDSLTLDGNFVDFVGQGHDGNYYGNPRSEEIFETGYTRVDSIMRLRNLKKTGNYNWANHDDSIEQEYGKLKLKEISRP